MHEGNMNGKSKEIILGSLVADTYCLGAHWVYMQMQLDKANLDWEGLNAPVTRYHNTKLKGDFTHYGDQNIWLYEYLKKYNTFEPETFIKVWEEKMSSYTGYVDENSKETLRNLNIPLPLPCGGVSDDLSVIGRIAPLLLVSKSEDEFLKNVRAFVLLTHYSEVIKEASEYFAKVLWAVIHGADIIESLKEFKQPYTHRLKEYATKGFGCQLDTFEAIREFGPACDTEEGFPGVIYLLNKYGNDYKTIMRENAKAGGDSSARGMLISMLLVAAHGKEIIPQQWINEMNYKI